MVFSLFSLFSLSLFSLSSSFSLSLSFFSLSSLFSFSLFLFSLSFSNNNFFSSFFFPFLSFFSFFSLSFFSLSFLIQFFIFGFLWKDERILVLFRTVGFGAGPGKQTRSCQVQTNKKCFLPYYQNQSLSDCLEHLTFQISKQSLQFSSPNFFLIFSRITFPDILLLCFQKHSYLVSLILDHLQRDRFKIWKFYFLVHNVQLWKLWPSCGCRRSNLQLRFIDVLFLFRWTKCWRLWSWSSITTKWFGLFPTSEWWKGGTNSNYAS